MPSCLTFSNRFGLILMISWSLLSKSNRFIPSCLTSCPSPFDALVLAWHHDHLSHQSHGRKTHYHQRESQQWLDFAQGLLDDQFDLFKALVFEKLDSIVKASSLVEMVNSLIRPFLNTCRGQITQETLNLIMFYHNHRRYKGGKRKGKAPIELLTGETLEGDWVELFIQHKREAEQ